MKPKLFDMVVLKDGRQATIVDVLEPGVAYLAEAITPDGLYQEDDFVVKQNEILSMAKQSMS